MAGNKKPKREMVILNEKTPRITSGEVGRLREPTSRFPTEQIKDLHSVLIFKFFISPTGRACPHSAHHVTQL